jgi:hypothetical protein
MFEKATRPGRGSVTQQATAPHPVDLVTPEEEK